MEDNKDCDIQVFTEDEEKYLSMLENEKKTSKYHLERMEWRAVNMNEFILKDIREMFDLLLVKIKENEFNDKKGWDEYFSLRQKIDDLFLVDRNVPTDSIAYKAMFKGLNDIRNKIKLIDTIHEWIHSGKGAKEKKLYIKSDCCEFHSYHYFPHLYLIHLDELENESETCKDNTTNIHDSFFHL